MPKSVLVLNHEDFEIAASFVGPDARFVAIAGCGRATRRTTEEIERYLPRAILTPVLNIGWVALVNKDWAEYLVGRLASGLIVADVTTSYDDAQIWIGDHQ
jgi:hypothetical protein